MPVNGQVAPVEVAEYTEALARAVVSAVPVSRWPVDTGRSKRGFYAEGTRVMNRMYYAPYVERRFGVIQEIYEDALNQNEPLLAITAERTARSRGVL